MNYKVEYGNRSQTKFSTVMPGKVFVVHGGVYVLGEDGVSHLVCGGDNYFKTMKFGPDIPVSLVEFTVFKTGRNRIPSNGGRAKELATHLREQAKIFRDEDLQGRGANELEEAARILESLQ
jgi:hypothetical protein